MSAILKLSHIRFQYVLPGPKKAAVPVFHDLSFTLEPGEKVGLIGSNGVGKSTLLKLIVGLLPLQAGNLEVCGLPLDRDHLPAIREKTGYVFQDSDSQLFLPTVESDVSFALRNRGIGTEDSRSPGPGGDEGHGPAADLPAVRRPEEAHGHCGPSDPETGPAADG